MTNRFFVTLLCYEHLINRVEYTTDTHLSICNFTVANSISNGLLVFPYYLLFVSAIYIMMYYIVVIYNELYNCGCNEQTR